MARTTTLLLCLLVAAAARAQTPTANVVFLDGDPTTDPRPRVVDSRLIPGYTTAAGTYNGTSVQVQRLFANAANGFLPAAPLNVTITLPPPASQYTVAVNQQAPGRSVAWFGSPGIFDPLRVEIDPPPGAFQAPVRVTFFAPDATTTISYRVNGGPLTTWAGEVLTLAENATIQFSGSDGINTPVQKSATYVFLQAPCLDLDEDGIPDRIEVRLGLDPFVADSDFNGNLVDDFDEFIRGADAFLPDTPNYVAPLMADTDGDGWSDYDEDLRGTNRLDAASRPVAPNMRTVERLRTGTITGAGASAPPALPPAKPFPTSWRVDSVLPDGTVVDPGGPSADGTFTLRTGGQQFHLLRARAADGSGRVLLAFSPPEALCINTAAFCASAASPATWRAAWRTAYEASVFRTSAGAAIDPRRTAEALLLNRYYEDRAGSSFVIATPGAGPGQDLVLGRRARRNEALLAQQLVAAVTPEMVDLVADYARYHTEPRAVPFLALLADHFAGRPVDPAQVPTGVRAANIAAVAAQTAAVIAAIDPDEAILTGTIAIDDRGFLLTAGSTTYRLLKLAETFVPGTTVSVKALVDVDGCGFSPVPAVVTGILSRSNAPLPPMVDTDGDGLDDDWELFFKGTLDGDGTIDSDGDGYTDGEEFVNGTNPMVPDQPFLAPNTTWSVF